MRVKSVKITLNDSAIAKIEESKEKAMRIVLDAVENDVSMRQVVPFRDGDLKDSVSTGIFKDTDKVIGWIGWNTPYARRLYFHPEYNFRQDKHANAQGLWMEYYQRENKGFQWLQEAYATALKMSAGGVIK